MSTKVLVVGGGGREHALVWKLHQSPSVGQIYCAPGNGGTQRIAQNIPIRSTDIQALADFAEKNKIDLTVVGMDEPLSLGIVDMFRSRGLSILGPTKAAAQIEASKVFSKELMQEAGVPTAAFAIFKEYPPALAYLLMQELPVVIKVNGLALGKGVYICKSREDAVHALEEIMVKRMYGKAGDKIVIEEYLDGEEISIHALCDGKHFSLFPASQDHKQALDGDKGKNTGGLGVVAPLSWVSDDLLKEVAERVISPILIALAQKGSPFSGLLYPGIKLTSRGLRVLEFNARFGDPECQAYMRLLENDLLKIFTACEAQTLALEPLHWKNEFVANVVLASQGYPDTYKKGFEIRGIEEAEKIPGVVVFHAGTVYEGGVLRTSGGRVLSVSAAGETLQIALDRAYQAAGVIEFEGKYYRHDIGKKALNRYNV